MTNLLAASRNLATRPADEHFASFASLRAAASFDQRNARTVDTAGNSLRVVAEGDELKVTRGGAAFPMTHHGARALLRMAGASPDFVFDRLTPQTAAVALSEALSRGSADDVRLLLGPVTDSEGNHTAPRLRAITSTSYCRVWDADVYAEIDRWLIGAGFKPALPTLNTDAQRNNIMGNNKPCLFRGDADSFAFFMHEETREGAGDRPVRRGVFVKNSEVGRASLAPTRFLFDDFCANFIVWGAKAAKTLRIVHRGDNDAHLLRRFARELRHATPEIAQQELDVLRKAADVVFAKDTEEAAERLNVQFGLSQARSAEAIKRAAWAENRNLKPLTFAWAANGVTSLAKETTYADDLVELATIGGDIYLAGAAS